jgi:hypothetical protein
MVGFICEHYKDITSIRTITRNNSVSIGGRAENKKQTDVVYRPMVLSTFFTSPHVEID